MRHAPRIAVVVAAVAAVLGGSAGPGAASTAAYGVFAVDSTDGALVHVDPSTSAVGPSIPVGQAPFDVAITADHRTAYVVRGFPSVVVPIDLTTTAVGTPIAVQCAGNIALVPGQPKAYVTQGCGLKSVVPIDLSTGTAGTPIDVGQDPFDVAVAPDGATAYATTGDGTVSSSSALVPVDVASDTAGTPIPLGLGRLLAGVAVTPDGGTAFVASQLDGTVIPVDLAARTAGTSIEVSSRPAFLVVTPDGATVYVTHSFQGPNGLGEPQPGGVTPIDVATQTALPDIDAGLQTWGVAVSSDSTTAFATNLEGELIPIDVATQTAAAPIILPGQALAVAIGPHISDTTPPTVSLQTTPAAATGGGGTWFNGTDLVGGTLTVTATATDAVGGLGGSGVAETTCAVDGVTTSAAGDRLVVTGLADGVHTLSCTATDSFHNVTEPPVTATYRVDTTAPSLAPTVTGTGPDGAVLVGDQAPVASPNASDAAGSGVASSSCGVPDASAAGLRTLDCTATDIAGNSTSAQGTYVVQYRLAGLSPTDGTTTRAGQPLKISVSLVDANGAPAGLCDGCTVTFRAFAVNGSGEDAGPFALRYHNGSGEYRYSWKPSVPGTTRIAVSVSYPGTSVATTVSALITVS